jgi:hypothetical protein
MYMYKYAEEHCIISGTQAGFCKNTSTHKQLQTLVMAIEDARLTAQDLYTMQVDFSSAFMHFGMQFGMHFGMQ